MIRLLRRARTGTLYAVGFLVIGALVMLLRQGPDYRIALPGKYELVRVYSGANCLVETRYSAGILEPNIDRYAVWGRYVIGHVSSHPEFESVPGYFILDTATGTLTTGLCEGDLHKAYRRLGIRGIPTLRRPSRLDTLHNIFDD